MIIFRLEPIVERIKQKRSAVICPTIDAINDNTMAHPRDSGIDNVGGFSWTLGFTWFTLSERRKNRKPTDILE